jgi:hypothetical protein
MNEICGKSQKNIFTTNHQWDSVKLGKGRWQIPGVGEKIYSV